MADNDDIKILIVDDEEDNCFILNYALGRIGYDNSEIANDGDIALETLEQDPSFDIILLDRMMPNVSGLEVMANIRNNPKFAHIITAFQSGKVSPQDMNEFIESGSEYLLCKPFTEESLKKFIQPIAERIRIKRKVREMLKNDTPYSTNKNKIFHISSPEDALVVTVGVARFFPEPYLAIDSIYEVLINSIEHGNLGIGGENKTRIITEEGFDTYKKELTSRLENKKYKDKTCKVYVEKNEDAVILKVIDEGNGFEHNKHKSVILTPNQITEITGRGIPRARRFFDSIEYENDGRTAICSLKVK